MSKQQVNVYATIKVKIRLGVWSTEQSISSLTDDAKKAARRKLSAALSNQSEFYVVGQPTISTVTTDEVD